MDPIIINRSHCKGSGSLSNQKTICKYSVTIDGEIPNDRSNARDFIDENIRDEVNFDLKIGFPEKFIDKTLHYKNEACLLAFVRWAETQKETSLSEVFGGAEFVAWRGTMKLIALAVKIKKIDFNMRYPEKLKNIKENAWTLIAQKIGGVILISKHDKMKPLRAEVTDVASYHESRFGQYMTTEKPNDDINYDFGSRPIFEIMVRSQLEVKGQPPLKLCCGGKIDAVRGDDLIELKSMFEGRENAFFRNLSTVIQSDIVGVRTIVTGIKKRENGLEYTFKKVVKDNLEDIKNIVVNRGTVGDHVAHCYSFLYSVLSEIKKFLDCNDACLVSYDPLKGAVVIKQIAADDANANFRKENHDGSCKSDLLMNKFNGRKIHRNSINIYKADCKGSGSLSNQKTICEYSVTVDREIRNDRSNARYLIDENIRDEVNFDLKIGFPEKFIDKTLSYVDEACLLALVKWAITQREETGGSLKEVFGGAEFVSWRGTMKLIARTLNSAKVYNWTKEKQKIVDQNAWTLVAHKIGGVILISEHDKNYVRGDVASYSGVKFEQYMTTDKPNGRPDDVNSILDNRPTFEIMVRSQLEMEGQSPLQLCCGGEIDAVRGDDPIELKSKFEGREKFFTNINGVIQSELVGVRTIVTGLKDRENPKEYIVKKVVENSLEDVKSIIINKSNDTVGDHVARCYSFLHSVLSEIKKFLDCNTACSVSYDPLEGAVVIKGISAEDAKEKFGKENENGDFIIDMLMDKFNLREN